MNTATFVPTGGLPPITPCYPVPVPPSCGRPTGPTDLVIRPVRRPELIIGLTTSN